MDTGFDLERFVDAQQGVYEAALAELRAGRKRSHWMWFIFPQVAGLGQSDMARRYAIRSADEAAAYLAHPVLGERLRECATAVLGHGDEAIGDIFPHPDDLKFHSSMTLFARAVADNGEFLAALTKYYGAREDAKTLNLLEARNAR
jgi:uncharacterized protein (DUF1810 family)